MTSDLATVKQTQGVSVWRALANETQASAIAGDLLLFKQGVWFIGEDQKEVKPNFKFIANMNEIWVGYVRWFNKSPVEHQLVRLIDGLPIPQRNELGHLDEGAWETDATGEPKDPWSRTQRMVMKDVSNGNLATFTTSSWGGSKALGKLAGDFDSHSREHPDCYPVVQLTTETRKSKEYGPIPEPRFKVVDWQPWDGKKANGHKKTDAKAATSASVAEEIDDSIPF
jgi:hypothetical protein